MGVGSSGGNGHWWRRAVWLGSLLFLVAAGLSILLNRRSGPLHLVPAAFRDPAAALVVLAVGSAVSFILERYVFRQKVPIAGARPVTAFRFLSRLVLYVAVALAMLAAFGASVSSVLFGSAFLTVILGLAGQSMLSNMLAGVWLVVFHPFSVGERIEFMTWQYPVLMPSFPHEAMSPAYAGTVVDINLMYTAVTFDNGLRYSLPNGILVQAAIANRSRAVERRLRMRVDVSLTRDPDLLIPRIQERLQHTLTRPMADTAQVLVADVGPETYGLVVQVMHADDTEDRLRSQILRAVVGALAAPAATPEAGTG